MDLFFSIIAIVVLILFLYFATKRPGTALLLYLPLCGLFSFVAMLFRDEENLLGSVIMCISTAVIIFIVTPLCIWLWGGDKLKDRWKRNIGKVIFFCLLVFVGIALVFPALISLIGVYFFFFVVFFIVSIGSFVISSKRATLGFVITTIGASLRQNLPLPAALRTAVTGQPCNRKIILEQVADWLTQGYSLAESLKNGYPKMPANMLSQICQAEKINQLPQAIESIEHDLVRQADESKKAGPIKPFLYVSIIFLFASAITLGLAIIVIPKFSTVLQEFSLNDIPPATKALMAFTDFIWFQTHGLIIVAILIIIFISFIIDARTRFFGRNPEKPFLASKIKDWVRWHTPVIHWYEFNYSALSLVELLRNSVTAGIPTHQAFKSSTNLDLNYCFKKKLIKLTQELQQGDNIASTIIKYNLPKPIAWAYKSANNQGQLANFFELLENFYRSNYSYMINMAKYILAPLSVVAIGLFVGFTCYAIFLPMVEILESLTDVVP